MLGCSCLIHSCRSAGREQGCRYTRLLAGLLVFVVFPAQYGPSLQVFGATWCPGPVGNATRRMFPPSGSAPLMGEERGIIFQRARRVCRREPSFSEFRKRRRFSGRSSRPTGAVGAPQLSDVPPRRILESFKGKSHAFLKTRCIDFLFLSFKLQGCVDVSGITLENDRNAG